MTTFPLRFAVAGIWLSFSLLATAQSPSSTLRDIHAPPSTGLGYWDDAFACPGQDTFVGRRGASLYALPMSDSPDLKRLCTNPKLQDARFKQGIADGKRLWLFTNSSSGSPYAIDARTGQIADFIAPTVKNSAQTGSPGSTAGISPTVDIQRLSTAIMFPQFNAALVEISGYGIEPGKDFGGRFFWMSLKSGAVHLLPSGWQFEYMSPDESVAVFSRPHGFDVPLFAIDMKTAEPVVAIPSELQPHVEDAGMGHSWIPEQINLVVDPEQPDQRPDQTAQAIFTRKPSTNDFDYFWGFTIDGHTYPIRARDNFLGPFRTGSTDEVPHSLYFGNARAGDGFVGFLCNTGTNDATSSLSLCLAPIDHAGAIDMIHPIYRGWIEDFALLAKGACIFLNFLAPSGDHRSCEAFFHRYGAVGSQNILDGVERLPPLPAEIAHQPWMMDQLTVQLIKGFGSDQTHPIALCIFHQTRRDVRQPIVIPAIPSATWQRAIIVTSDGTRFLTDLFPDGRLPQQAWIHASSSAVTIINAWSKSGLPEGTQLHLQKTQISLANSAGR
jgi:hypothetical protein